MAGGPPPTNVRRQQGPNQAVPSLADRTIRLAGAAPASTTVWAVSCDRSHPHSKPTRGRHQCPLAGPGEGNSRSSMPGARVADGK
jgi:hypothetical protein